MGWKWTSNIHTETIQKTQYLYKNAYITHKNNIYTVLIYVWKK